MDGTGPLATPNDLYTRLGTASAPMLIDLRRQFAFKAGDHLSHRRLLLSSPKPSMSRGILLPRESNS